MFTSVKSPWQHGRALPYPSCSSRNPDPFVAQADVFTFPIRAVSLTSILLVGSFFLSFFICFFIYFSSLQHIQDTRGAVQMLIRHDSND